MRSVRRGPGCGAVLAAVALALCACDRGGTPEQDRADAPSPPAAAPQSEAELQAALERGDIHEPPPMFDSVYQPVSTTARSITDTLEVAGDEIQLGFGHVYRTEAVRMAPAADIAAFARVASAQGATAFEVRKVTEELVNARAVNGGLCRPEATTFIVLGAAPDADGVTQAVSMLAYQGAAAPTAATVERGLCGTFLYAREESPE